jgi:AraC family L-rhamnose operon transcriptional activator RhaR
MEPGVPLNRMRASDVFPKGDAPIQVERLQADKLSYPPHDHDFFELTVVFRGTGIHRSIHGQEPFERGRAVVLRPGTWHELRQGKGLDVAICSFPADLLRHELAWTLEDPGLSYLFWRGPLSLDRRGLMALTLDDEALAACGDCLDRLEAIQRDPDPLRRGDRIALLLLLLGELARHTGPADRAPDQRSRKTHSVVVRGTEMLEQDLAQEWTLLELAARLRVSQGHLVRLFTRWTGLPPLAYLAHRRAETAALLLVSTDLPVGEVGERVGYPDANYFARRFRRHFGLSASGYRARFARGHDSP